ncbi:SUKH-4 family immunity protein [Streptomyces anulatus]
MINELDGVDWESMIRVNFSVTRNQLVQAYGLDNPCPAALDAITLGSRFDHYGIPCPAESRSWWTLGYLFTSLIALDPASGKVYAFPEGSSGHLPLHRDVESLVYALIEFRRLEVGHDSDVEPVAGGAGTRHLVTPQLPVDAVGVPCR